jgi:c-di-AMP phosphodiesterase-like protein
MTSLNTEKHLTANDQEQLENIKKDVNSHTNFILENGYTGIIDDSHKDDIVGTIMVSIIGRRLLYLNEFAEGLLNSVLETVKANAEIAKQLFVIGIECQKVDANYVFSLLSPEYSVDGTSKLIFENPIMDNFKDFLNTLEDKSICGYTEAIAWNDGNPTEQVSDGTEELGENSQFQMANLTPAGVLGWLTVVVLIVRKARKRE